MLVVSAAEAQTGRPVQLVPPPGNAGQPPAAATPPTAAQSGPPGVSTLPATVSPANPPTAKTPAANAPPPGAGGTADQSDIQVSRLVAPEVASLGTLDQANGALPLNMWRGSQRDNIALLLARLGPSTSPVLQSLARRVLLSPAGPPAAALQQGGGADQQGPDLVALRISALDALGLIDDASELARLVGTRDANPAFLHAAIVSDLLARRPREACGRVAVLPQTVRDVEWQKLNAFCRSVNGEHEAASISAGLLREQNVNDPAFFALLGLMNGEGDSRIDALASPSPLHLAMFEAASKPIPAEALRNARPPVLAAIAHMKAAAPAVRVTAGERAITYGAISGETLSEIYAAQTFKPADLASPAGASAVMREGLGNALLYQAVQAEKVPAARAEALKAAFAHAKGNGAAPPLWILTVYRRTLLDLQPEPDIAWFAPDMTRALLVLGEMQHARIWATAVQGDAVNALGPFYALANPEAPPPDSDMLRNWHDAGGTSENSASDLRASLLYTLLEGVGKPVPADRWQALLSAPLGQGSAIPAPAVWHGMNAAAADNRLGETVLYVLLSFGDSGPAAADPATLNATIGALRRIGLDDDARAIAVEAAFGRGL
ncbi:MAG TPA: hypothetical protein VEU47_20445 [Candidatus Cybelea sp.]|nr:hypothetical protein [Candidatus Cybelea sp.]